MFTTSKYGNIPILVFKFPLICSFTSDNCVQLYKLRITEITEINYLFMTESIRNKN